MVASLKAHLPPPYPQHQREQDNADDLHLWLSPLVPCPTEAKGRADAGGNATLPICEQTYRWLQQLGLPLPPNLYDRLSRFRHPHLQSQRIAGLRLLCTALHRLAHISPAATLAALTYDTSGDTSSDICGNTSGCPRLHFPSPTAPAVPDTSWRVSFSYAPGWVACALRRLSPAQVQASAHMPALGVDVEHSPLQGPPNQFATIFTPAEQQAIAQAHDSDDERTRLWTCKEALLKALGSGFSCDPRSIATHKQRHTTLPLVSSELGLPSLLPLHCTRIAASVHPLVGAQKLFWQSIALSPHAWLTVASFPAWEKTRISFLRLV